MDLFYETSREMLSLDEMLEGDLKFCLDEMEPELKDLNWSSGSGFENLTNWGGVIGGGGGGGVGGGGGGGGDYWSANCWTLSGQQDHRLPAFDLTLTPENTPANKMVNPKSVIPSRIRSMQFEFEMEMMANADDDSDDDDDQDDHNRTIDVDDVEESKPSPGSFNGTQAVRRSPSPSGNEEEDYVDVKDEPLDEDDQVDPESSLDETNECEIKEEEEEEEEEPRIFAPSRLPPTMTSHRVFSSLHKPQIVKQSINVSQHVQKQVQVKTQVQVHRPAQGGKPRTLWLLKQQPVKQGYQSMPPEKDVDRLIKTQTVTNPNGVQILKPNLQKLKIITSSSPDSPQQMFISRTAPAFTSVTSSPPPILPKLVTNGNTTPGSVQTAMPTLQIGGRTFQKPPCSYSCLIVMALKNSDTGYLPVSEIYNFMCDNFPFFQCAPPGWKNSVRHNLSMNDCFAKIEKDPLSVVPSSSPPTSSSSIVGSATPTSVNVTISGGGGIIAVGNTNGATAAGNSGGGVRKGCLWTMNPDKIIKMDDELAKWSRKDPDGMRGAMKNPRDLDKLIKGELVIRPSTVKHDIKSEDEDDECENDDDDDGGLGKEIPIPVNRLKAERIVQIMPDDDDEEEMEEDDDDEEVGGSDDDSNSSGEEDEEDAEDYGELELDYESDSDEDRVPPSLKPFDLRHSIDPLASSSLENNNKTKLKVSRPSTADESAPKRPRILSPQVKYVAVAKSSGLVTPVHRQPMRLL